MTIGTGFRPQIKDAKLRERLHLFSRLPAGSVYTVGNHCLEYDAVRQGDNTMNKHARVVLILAAAPLVAAMVAGCPQPTPPFDATGTYTGTWSGTIDSKGLLTVTDCPLELNLEHDPDLPFFNFTVIGTTTINWSCLLPPELLEFLALEPQDISLPMLAELQEDGSLTLDIEIDTGGVLDLPLRNFAFQLDALGTDIDGDGFMDRLEGALSLSATYEDNGTQTVTANGTFVADAV